MAGPYYIMPSGKLPMIDGKPVFITEAQFLGCCCNMCQWKATYVWDCLEDEWILPTEEDETLEWVPAERDEGTYETGDPCTRLVYGEIVNCLIDPKPAAPTAPPVLTTEEKELCCPPCECPVDVLDAYSVTSMTWTVDRITRWERYTLKSSVVLTTKSNPCIWSNDGIFKFEQSFDDGDTWSEDDRTFTIQAFLSTAIFSSANCEWWLRADFVEMKKYTGLSPKGSYKSPQVNYMYSFGSIS